MVDSTFSYYGISLPGRSHLEKGIPNQDSYIIKELTGAVLLAVADGVGSAIMAGEGSHLAVTELGDYIHSALSDSTESDWLKILENAFEVALAAIISESLDSGHKPEDYDTTLTAVLYDGQELFVGHCGDGGVIGMDNDGRYHLLTEVQKGDYHNQVSPLRLGSTTWVFERFPGPFAGFSVMTDGLLDVAVPLLLINEPEKIHTGFLRPFLNADMVNLDADGILAIKTERETFLYSDRALAITDDMTIVAAVNQQSEIIAPPEDYFAEPDWQSLRMERYYLLYPDLRPVQQDNSLESMDKKPEKEDEDGNSVFG